jgi:DNA polymerase-4
MDDALTILHVDMDAFYASVEQRDHPELRGKPVIVGGTAGRGVVCAASYEVRPFGVRSAMPMVTARRLCPDAIVLPVRMSYYAEISRQIRDILLSYTPLVEPLSLDEAFLDVQGSEGLFGPAPDIARKIKDQIKRETNLIASVGVAPNKFLAKLASDYGKPDGLVVIRASEVATFLAPLPVSRLWGVGARGEKRLHALGIRTVGDLATLPEAVVVQRLGEGGRHLWQLARGQDGRSVVPDREAKSISTETTFAEDIGDREALRTILLDLVDHLATRLRHAHLLGRCIELKIRSSEFRTWNRSHTLPEPTHQTDTLWGEASELFERSLTEEMLPLRLLGVGCSQLSHEDAVQGTLFPDEQRERQGALDRTVDEIRKKLGSGAIRRGRLLEPPQPGQ